MRNILIDCGYHKGESIERFKHLDILVQPWEIYAFEPNPDLFNQLDDKNVHLIDSAVWIEDGQIDFYIAEDSAGSSLIKHKSTAKLSETPIKVPCIDFATWLTELCKLGDYVIVNMNIEGAEYQVLPDLLKKGCMNLIDALYIEFHNIKVGVLPTVDQELIESIKSQGVQVIEHAL